MSLPDECPFCGATPYTTASGNQCRGGDRWVLFSCGTSIYAGQDLRRTQSRKCEDAERARLAARVAELEARCKRLEEAGDEMADWNMTAPDLGCDPELLRKWRQAKEARDDEAWARERTVLVEFQPVTSGWYASAPDGVVGINATAPTIHGALRALREKMEARPAEKATPCMYCLRVECECSDADVCPDMGDK